ncbi:MAG: hypothetical protein F6J86_45605 [Symploca sp. SIO1B1]|nr:hypothetical protein [Symploca sp. SIO1B1]
MFSLWYPTIRKGRYIVVAVVTDTIPQQRNWIVTAYMARKVTQGEVIWKQN